MGSRCLANARQLQAVFNYERTLLQAFTDVVNQLAALENLEKSYELQSQQVETLARSVEVSNVLFQSARADYMEVLLTRRDSLEAESARDGPRDTVEGSGRPAELSQLVVAPAPRLTPSQDGA